MISRASSSFSWLSTPKQKYRLAYLRRIRHRWLTVALWGPTPIGEVSINTWSNLTAYKQSLGLSTAWSCRSGVAVPAPWWSCPWWSSSSHVPTLTWTTSADAASPGDWRAAWSASNDTRGHCQRGNPGPCRGSNDDSHKQTEIHIKLIPRNFIKQPALRPHQHTQSQLGLHKWLCCWHGSLASNLTDKTRGEIKGLTGSNSEGHWQLRKWQFSSEPASPAFGCLDNVFPSTGQVWVHIQTDISLLHPHPRSVGTTLPCRFLSLLKLGFKNKYYFVFRLYGAFFSQSEARTCKALWNIILILGFI